MKKVVCNVFAVCTAVLGIMWNAAAQTAGNMPQPAASLVMVHATDSNAKPAVIIMGEHTQSFTAKRIVKDFKINRYETTYALWHQVLLWATANGYEFQNPGQEGSAGRRGRYPSENGMYEPVSNINWRDAVVWCNALSEMTGRTPCYTAHGTAVRDSTDAATVDIAECNFSADGYRLPTETEWEFAARRTIAGFQRGDLASGSVKADGTSTDLISENDLSWTSSNTIKTQPAGTAGLARPDRAEPGSGRANALGIFDMCGNVLEFCWDWYADYKDSEQAQYSAGPEIGFQRVCRGGSWSPYTAFAYAGDRYAYDPDEAYNYMGFRFCRSITTAEYTNPDVLEKDEYIVF